MLRTALLRPGSVPSSWYRQQLLPVWHIIESVRARAPTRERALLRRFAALRERYFYHYWLAVAGDIGADIDDVGDGFYRLIRRGQRTFVYQGEVMLDDHLTLRIAGNKPLVNRLLQEQGFSVPDYLEYNLSTTASALSFMQASTGNCVVKPASGAAGGRGVCTKINSQKRLLQASCKAAVHSSSSALMIEQEHVGGNYRLLYINGTFIDAIRREAPILTGDGYSSVRALVEKENARRLCDGDSALSPLTLDLDACYTLADQGMSERHVAAAGEAVSIKTASNQYSRNQNTTVKNSVHPSIIEFGQKISCALGVTLSGVDLMLRDHTVPLHESLCRLNEINTTPGLHHHALISNAEDGVNAGAVVLDYIFSLLELK